LLAAAAAIVLLLAGFLVWWFGLRNGGTTAGEEIVETNGDSVAIAEQRDTTEPENGGESTGSGSSDDEDPGFNGNNGEGSPSEADADGDLGNGSEQEQRGTENQAEESQTGTAAGQDTGQSAERDQPQSADAGLETEQDTSGTISEDPGVAEQPEADVPASFFETPRMMELRQIEFTGEDGKTYSFQITVGDIIRATNIISDLNGYRRLGTENKPGVKDSHWIYPGDILLMPEGEEYRISEGDTIWHIAAGYIQNHTVKDLEQFNTIINTMDGRGVDDVRASLEQLLENSYSSYFRRLVEQKIQTL
jgi:hypothetical protein